MKKLNLNDFFKGWLVGKFSPVLFEADIEVGIARHTKGEYHQDHYHKLSTEYNIVVEGQVKINEQIFGPDDIFILYPYEVSIAEFLTDVTIVIIRDRSDPTDKYLIKSAIT